MRTKKGDFGLRVAYPLSRQIGNPNICAIERFNVLKQVGLREWPLSGPLSVVLLLGVVQSRQHCLEFFPGVLGGSLLGLLFLLGLLVLMLPELDHD